MYNTSNPTSSDRFARYAGKGLTGLAFAILVAAGIALMFLWDKLPERWPVHWGANGQPNGWATRTGIGVFFPIGFGLFMCAFLECVVALSRLRLRSGRAWKVSAETADAIAQLTTGFIRLVEVGLAGVFAALSLMLPLGSLPHEKLIFLTFIWFAGIVVVGCWRLMKGAAEMKAAGLTRGVEGWNGLVYRNSNDPRIWVPKITGMGYTLNFGHAAAWWILLACLAIPIIALAWVIASAL